MWLTGAESSGWAGPAALAAARVVASALFRLDRMRWTRWNHDDRLIWMAATLSGSTLGLLSAGALGVALPLRAAVVDALLYLHVGALLGERAPQPSAPARLPKAPALIYGAGTQGRLLLAELRRPDSGFEPVGWLDDDPAKAGAVLAGEPVLGTIDALPFLAELHGVGTVFTAIAGLSAERLERAAELAEMAHARLIVLPTVRDAVRAVRPERALA